MPISTIFSSGFLTNIPTSMEAKGIMPLLRFTEVVLPVNSPTSISGSMAITYGRLRPMSPMPSRPTDWRRFAQPSLLSCFCVSSSLSSPSFSPSGVLPPAVSGSRVSVFSSTDCGGCCFFCACSLSFCAFQSRYSCSWPGAMTDGTAEKFLPRSTAWGLVKDIASNLRGIKPFP